MTAPSVKSKSKPARVVSPSPKQIQSRNSFSVCRFAFWSIFFLLILIMLACILDYEQAKMVNHYPLMPREVHAATKYAYDGFKSVPNLLEIFGQKAKHQVIVITGYMHLGDKSVAQLLFGNEIEKENLVPSDIQEDFDTDNQIDEIVQELTDELMDRQVREEVLAEIAEEKMEQYE